MEMEVHLIQFEVIVNVIRMKWTKVIYSGENMIN
jgi:hypothetical protein